jgi:hypothetical protein
MYPSINVNLCLFYASEQAKSKKGLLIVNTISHGHHIFVHTQVGNWGKATNRQKTEAVSKTAWRFGPEDFVKTKFIMI